VAEFFRDALAGRPIVIDGDGEQTDCIGGEMAMASAGLYRPGHPERTVLYRVLAQHFERFEQIYDERFAPSAGSGQVAHPPEAGSVKTDAQSRIFGARV